MSKLKVLEAWADIGVAANKLRSRDLIDGQRGEILAAFKLMYLSNPELWRYLLPLLNEAVLQEVNDSGQNS